MVGETILHYKIIEKLGEGGMGEVYKAQDTKLDRFVALKFLPSQMTASEDDKARFIQEAKAASAMNHPNVCTIYDIQDNNGQIFIVMEYVEGKTLKDKKDSLSEKQILEIGIQMAEGLAAAHEKGIVHRDIKPENIMIRKDGIVQIMDFGLAKLRETSGVSRLTKAGTTMGTMGYMSPEQVQGLDVDHRTDIFSLGVVLYEMLAGESPFKGVHETAIMYEIVNVDPPPISTLGKNITPELDEIILECLEKDKDERCQAAKELAKDLRKVKKSTGNRKSRIYTVNTSSIKTSSEPVNTSKSSGSFTIEISNKRIDLLKILNSNYFRWGIVIILGITVIYLTISRGNSDQQTITSATSILPPTNVDFTGNAADPGDFEISHDGKTIVFAGTDSTGKSQLWLRQLSSENAKPIPGTDGAYYPFWSYNDKFVAYFIPNKLMKIELSTGISTEICPAQDGRGGSFNKNGDIVFSPNSIGGLYQVSSNGGAPREIVKTDKNIQDQSLRFPFFLSDGIHFLYSIENDFYGASPTDVVKAGSINSDFDRVIMKSSTNAEYTGGYIFFTSQSALLCQKINPDNLRFNGDLQTIASNINYDATRIKASFSVSTSGDLIFLHGFQANSNFVLFGVNGNETELPIRTNATTSGTPLSPEIGASLSDDKKGVLYVDQGIQSDKTEISEYNLATKIISKITFNMALNSNPIWSPDGKLAAFSSGPDIYIKNANGTGNERLVYKADSSYYKTTDDWSSDGNLLLVNDLIPRTGFQLIIVNIKNGSSSLYLSSGSTNIGIRNGKFSRSMKWILYSSNQSGTGQLYVRPLNKNESGLWQISTDGAAQGWWVNNDKDIIYLTKDNKVFKVSVNGSGDEFIVGSSQYLFSLNDRNLSGLSDVSKDGSEFLGTRRVENEAIPPLTYVQNWKGLLNKNDK